MKNNLFARLSDKIENNFFYLSSILLLPSLMTFKCLLTLNYMLWHVTILTVNDVQNGTQPYSSISDMILLYCLYYTEKSFKVR